MKKEDRIREKMLQEYPETTTGFQDMIKARISEQVGKDKAEQICVEQRSRTRARHTLLRPLKWVAAASILLICGTTAAAAVNPELRNYLLEHIKQEDVDAYMQDVEPEVKEKPESTEKTKSTEKDDAIKELELALETPLWEVSDAWFDGATLHFSASPSEEAKKLNSKYEIYPSDHSAVNGQDILFECPDAESAFDDISEGEKNGVYHCMINLSGRDINGDMDVTFKLHIVNRDGVEPAVRRAQEIKFSVDGEASGIKVVANGYEEQELPDGKLEILQFKLAPSILHMEVKYTFYGADAKEKADQLYYSMYYIEDSSGNRIHGGWPKIGDQRLINEEADGGYSVTLWWEVDSITYEGVDIDTSSLTFLPWIYTERRSDGKGVQGSDQILEWATFTVPVVEGE